MGPNSVQMRILELLSPTISSLFSQVINESSQEFSLKMKLAKVVPLFKEGCPLTPSSYRPNSILSIFSKVLAKVMYKSLYTFLEKLEILYTFQFGFRTSHSIDHALISLRETIKISFENRKFNYGIFNDLKKVFDTVNHNILLAMLEHYGVRGTALEWFKPDLMNRRQYVSVNRSDSTVFVLILHVVSYRDQYLFLFFFKFISMIYLNHHQN